MMKPLTEKEKREMLGVAFQLNRDGHTRLLKEQIQRRLL